MVFSLTLLFMTILYQSQYKLVQLSQRVKGGIKYKEKMCRLGLELHHLLPRVINLHKNRHYLVVFDNITIKQNTFKILCSLKI